MPDNGAPILQSDGAWGAIRPAKFFASFHCRNTEFMLFMFLLAGLRA
jgi:hypothetical protein